MTEMAKNIQISQPEDSLWDRLSLWLQFIEGGPSPEEHPYSAVQLLEQKVDDLETKIARLHGEISNQLDHRE